MKNLGKILGFFVTLVVLLFVIVCKRQPLNPLDPNNPYTLGKDYICHADSIGIGRVKLSWVRINQSQIKGYRIYRYKPNESPVAIADVDTNLFFDSQLQSGQTYIYYYRIIWEDNREIHKSPEDMVKTFDSPTGFSIKDVTRTKIELKWDDLGWLDNYSYCRIYRRQNGDFVLYDSTSSSNEYVDSNVQENITYRYKLLAVANDGATSNFTSDVYATPRNSVPRIDSIKPPNPVAIWGHSVTITCYAYDHDGDSIHYNWEALDGGEITGSGSRIVFTVPQDSLSTHRIKVTVSDDYGQGDDSTINVLSIQDTWLMKTPMPTARMMLGIGVVNNKIYAIGGYRGYWTDPVTTNEEYDPVTNTWTTKAPMPTARGALAIGVINNKIYAIGGNGGRQNENEEYDPVTNSWTIKAPMPSRRRGLAIGIVNNKIYAIGGHNGGMLSTNEEYNPVINTWTTKEPMPTPRDALAVGVVNNSIYVIGGGDLGITLAINEEYNPVTNSWTTKASMPTPRVWLGIGVANNKIYAIGGDNFGDLSTNEEYNPATNSWTTRAPMPGRRTFLCIGVVTNRIYAIGGRQYTTTLSKNEEYITPP